mmetsp:Transcript_32776/g.53260  ORF Transcript_32776/g.53260 Transcript_32776/m.53260 type:complete len:239 (+) Transcript_32776:1-717(+)
MGDLAWEIPTAKKADGGFADLGGDFADKKNDGGDGGGGSNPGGGGGGSGPGRLKPHTVGKIIEMWRNDLAQNAEAFTSQATQVMKVEKELLDSGKRIKEVEKNIEKVFKKQEELNTTLDQIETNQTELDEQLKGLEKYINDTEKRTRTSPDDRKRQQTHKLAEEIDNNLRELTEKLIVTQKQLNEQTESRMDKNSPLYLIVRTLNQHMDTLHWIEKTSNKLEKKFGKASRELSRTTEY